VTWRKALLVATAKVLAEAGVAGSNLNPGDQEICCALKDKNDESGEIFVVVVDKTVGSQHWCYLEGS